MSHSKPRISVSDLATDAPERGARLSVRQAASGRETITLAPSVERRGAASTRRTSSALRPADTGTPNGAGSIGGSLASNASAPERSEDIAVLLRDFFRSIYFYARIGFVTAVVALVLGIVWWSGLRSSATASSTIIKKNLVETWWQPRALPDNWLRTLEADRAFMRSEVVGRVAQQTVVALGRISDRELNALADDSLWRTRVSTRNGLDDAHADTGEWVALSPRRNELVPISTSLERDPLVDSFETLTTIVEREPEAVVLQRSLAVVLAGAYREVRRSGEEPLVQSIAERRSARAMAGLADTVAQSGSGEITTRSTHASPHVAAFFANLLPAAFVAINDRQVIETNARNLRRHEQRLELSESDLSIHVAQANRLRQELDRQLSAATLHGTTAGLGLNHEQMRARIAQVGTQLVDLRSRRVEMDGQLVTLEREYRQLVDPLLNEIQQMERRLRSLRLTETETSPRRLYWEAQLRLLREEYETRGPDDFEPMQTNYHQAAAAKWKLDDLRKEVREINSLLETLSQQHEDLAIMIDRFPELAAPLEAHAIQMASSRAKVERFTEAVDEARLTAARVDQHYQWQHTATAAAASVPSKSHWLFILVLFAVAAGVAMTQLAAIFDSRVQTEQQAKAIVGNRMLTTIPALGKPHRFICRDTDEGRQTNNFIYNLFGILALNLRHLGFPRHGRALCVTSTMPGEGKTFVAFNLATYYAMQGMRTCLLNTDYRHAALEMFPDLDPDAIPGFVELLAGNGDVDAVEQCLYPTDIPNLFVCPPGRLTAAPTQVIDDDGFTEFLDDLRGRFDVVIVDCAPLLLVIDAAVVARQADATLLVAGLGVVKKAALQTCMDRLALQNVRLIGTVINRDRMASQSYYYREYGDLVQMPRTIDPLQQVIPPRRLPEPRANEIDDVSSDVDALGNELHRAIQQAEPDEPSSHQRESSAAHRAAAAHGGYDMPPHDYETRYERERLASRDAIGNGHVNGGAAAHAQGAAPAQANEFADASDSWAQGTVSSRRTPVAPTAMHTIGSVDDGGNSEYWPPFGHVDLRGAREAVPVEPHEASQYDDDDPYAETRAGEEMSSQVERRMQRANGQSTGEPATEFEPSLPGDATEGLPFDDALFREFSEIAREARDAAETEGWKREPGANGRRERPRERWYPDDNGQDARPDREV